MQVNPGSQADFHEYARRGVCIFKRYWHFSAPLAAITLWLSVSVVLQIPEYYQSDFVFALNPQSVTSKLFPVEKKGEDQKRIDLLVQETLNRPRLLGIIKALDLYPGSYTPAGKAAALQKLEASIEVAPVDMPMGRPTENSVKVSVTHHDAKQTYEISKMLSNIFLEESISRLRGEAKATTEFFDTELRTARKKLDTIDRQISEFVSDNYGRLPGHLPLELTRLKISDDELKADEDMMQPIGPVTSSLAPASEQSPAYEAYVPYGLPNLTGVDYQKARRELIQTLGMMRLRYSDRHPDVKAAQSRLAWLETQIAAQPKAAKRTRRSTSSKNVPAAALPSKGMSEDREQRKEEMTQVLANIRTMPQMQQQLDKMKRDYQLVVDNYQRLLIARQDATLQESLFKRWYASRFKLLEPPMEPTGAAGPNRPILLVGCAAASLAIFIALPFGFFFLNNGYQFRSQLEQATGLPVIGMVLSVDTKERKLGRRKGVLVSTSAFGTVVGLVVGMACIATGIL